MAILLVEYEFGLRFDEVSFVVPFECKDPKAKVERVYGKSVKNAANVNETVGAILVRDRVIDGQGEPTLQHVIVVKQSGRLCEIPAEAGVLVGTFSSSQGRHLWHVFVPKVPLSAPRLNQGRVASPPPLEGVDGTPLAGSGTAP